MVGWSVGCFLWLVGHIGPLGQSVGQSVGWLVILVILVGWSFRLVGCFGRSFWSFQLVVSVGWSFQSVGCFGWLVILVSRFGRSLWSVGHSG